MSIYHNYLLSTFIIIFVLYIYSILILQVFNILLLYNNTIMNCSIDLKGIIYLKCKIYLNMYEYYYYIIIKPILRHVF